MLCGTHSDYYEKLCRAEKIAIPMLILEFVLNRRHQLESALLHMPGHCEITNVRGAMVVAV
jgi:hypothetical protein